MLPVLVEGRVRSNLLIWGGSVSLGEKRSEVKIKKKGHSIAQNEIEDIGEESHL